MFQAPKLAAILLALVLLVPCPALASGGGSKEKEGAGNLLVLEPFMMNLADPGGKRYLKLAVTVQVKDDKQKAEISSRLPAVRDAVILALSTKTSKHLETAPGKNKLKAEVRQIIAQRCGLPENDLTLFFTDFMIQFMD